MKDALPHADAKTPAAGVRWMLRDDMYRVLAIESESFDHPWREADFVLVLRQSNCLGQVSVSRSVDPIAWSEVTKSWASEHEREAIYGYQVYELYKAKIVLLNIAVAEDCRRRGVGRRMVEELIKKLSPARRRQIVADVRETNLPAQRFFSSLGFAVRKICAGRFDGGEDAYRFVYRLRKDGKCRRP